MGDIAAKLTTITENQQRVYDAGYLNGKSNEDYVVKYYMDLVSFDQLQVGEQLLESVSEYFYINGDLDKGDGILRLKEQYRNTKNGLIFDFREIDAPSDWFFAMDIDAPQKVTYMLPSNSQVYINIGDTMPWVTPGMELMVTGYSMAVPQEGLSLGECPSEYCAHARGQFVYFTYGKEM